MSKRKIRILDIDLDFFLDRAYYGRERGDIDRLPTKGYKVWPHKEVQQWLEQHCLLSTERRLSGLFCEHHHEVFGHLRNMVAEQPDIVPFDLVHIDAHADLGLGEFKRCQYVFCELLHKEIPERFQQNVDDIITEGTWLLFVVANRWLRNLTYVHHYNERGDDFWSPICENKALTLPILRPDEYNEMSNDKSLEVRREPPVQFHIRKPEQYQTDELFDFAFVTLSPAYTPKEADELIPILSKYVDFDQEIG